MAGTDQFTSPFLANIKNPPPPVAPAGNPPPAPGAQPPPAPGGYYSSPFITSPNQPRSDTNQQLGTYGYNLDARPFDFNPNAFVDPNYANNQGMISAGYNAATGGYNDANAARVGMLADLSKMYTPMAYGRGPSIADATFKKNTADNINRILSMSAGMRRGGNVALANRSAMYTTGNVQANASQDAAIAKLNEVNMARQGLMGVQSAYGDVAQQHSQLLQHFLDQGLTLDQAQFQATMSLQQLMAAQHAAAQDRHLGGKGTGGGPVTNAVIGAVGGAAQGAAQAGATAAMSDRTKKTDIKKGGKNVRKLLDTITAYDYKYKQPLYGEGKRHLGVMAQDLEKTPEGRSAVIDTPDGKMIHGALVANIALAAAADLHRRVKKMEAA